MFASRYFLKAPLACIIIFIACNSNPGSGNKQQNETGTDSTSLVNSHPDWIIEGNIYEVNVRQYTAEGTFKAFEKNLDRLKNMGVQTLWFMPINPISHVDRKGALGSYYAVADYTAVNPEFGTLDDWKELVTRAHKMGFKVILDWVPNHTGADNHWLKDHPDFYVHDSTGKALSPFDWTDVRQLNFKNEEMKDSMAAAMKFWLDQSHIDGFRCDHIDTFQADFWRKTIPELRTQKHLLMLAEAEGGWLYSLGFDMDYGWQMFHTMVDIAAGKKTVTALDTLLAKLDTAVSAHNGLQLYFTSNHDENSWNKADYGTMPGPVHAPFAVLTQTMPASVPLIYSGQEEPVPDSISFFYKDTIHFNKFARAGFYKTLLQLREEDPALAANASFRKINVGNQLSVFAYVREAEGKKIMVILNLSKGEQKIRITDRSLLGPARNVFKDLKEQVTDKEWKLGPWGYVVYEY